jgi:predicted AAA+ superfamily ATPase
MERKLMSELLKWKDRKGREPLLLEGARQVGKTYLLKDFGKRHFKNADAEYENQVGKKMKTNEVMRLVFAEQFLATEVVLLLELGENEVLKYR